MEVVDHDELGAGRGRRSTEFGEAAVVTLPGGDAYAVAVLTLAARGDRRLPRVDAAIGEAARVAVDLLR